MSVETTLPCLPLSALRLAEAEFARARRRKEWWGINGASEGSSSPANAFGRMIADLLEFRLQAVPVKKQKAEDLLETLSKKIHSEGEAQDSPRCIKFLQGKSGVRCAFWEDEFAPKFLLGCLLGTEELPDEDERKKVALRIEKYFFPHHGETPPGTPRNQREYFDPLLRGCANVQTAAEANAELQVLRYYLRKDAQPPGRGLIVRASGHRQFFQRGENDEMNASGRLTLKFLSEGGWVVYVFPYQDQDCPAAKTAHAFRDYVRKYDLKALPRLSLLPLSVKEVHSDSKALHGGSFLSPTFRYAYLAASEVAPMPEKDPTISKMLIPTQRSVIGPSAYEPDDKEIEVFEQWLQRFVLPKVKGFDVKGFFWQKKAFESSPD